MLPHICLWLLSLAPPDATPSAWDRADEQAAAGNHEAAVDLYAQAWEEVRAPAILYSWAQSERLRGRCDAAIPIYERFLAAAQDTPPAWDTEPLRAQWAEMRVNAEHQRGACREQTREPVVVPPPTPTTRPDAEVQGPSEATREPTAPRWRRDAAGWSLVAIGGAMTVTGAALLGVAAVTDRNAEDQSTHQRFRDAIDRAQLEQRIGIGVLAAGGALAIGGAVRLAIVARRGRTRSPTAWWDPRIRF